MPICSFYYKTDIVIPTCVSDDFPPVLPSHVSYLMIELMGEGERCQGGSSPLPYVCQAASRGITLVLG